jgi:hypothetical protein
MSLLSGVNLCSCVNESLYIYIYNFNLVFEMGALVFDAEVGRLLIAEEIRGEKDFESYYLFW